MAISSSYDWTLTRNQIIQMALEDLGKLDDNETPTAEQVAAGSRRLNAIVKSLQNRHIFLWTQEWVQKTFTASDIRTNLGTVYRCIRNHTSSSTTEPGQGANWTTYWIEDSSATSGGAWLTATAYTSIGEFSVDADTIGINQAFIRDSGDDTKLDIMPWSKYADISDKAAEGKPYMLVFDRQLTPKIYLHYQPDLTSYVLHYQRVRKLKDFDILSDNMDGPDSMLLMLVKMLRYEWCSSYGATPQEKTVFKAEAEQAFREVKSEDNEETDGLFLKGAF